MTTLLDEPTTTNNPPTQRNQIDSSQRLRAEMAAVRLSIHWPGTRKTLTPGQRDQAADTFGAEGNFLSAGKKLLDTGHPAWKACTQIRSRATKLWQGLSLPWPEPGVRLIRREDISTCDQQLAELRVELSEAVDDLNEHYEELKDRARDRLGVLYNSEDYPASLSDCFRLEWDFPSVEAPEYLRSLCPELYQAEQRRVQARFEEAVQLAEKAFVAELSELVSHLSERLTGQSDGKPKVFRDSAITNLQEFFERFRHLNVTGNSALEELVSEAQGMLSGVTPGRLRTTATLRHQVAHDLEQVRNVLDGQFLERPRRRIIRGGEGSSS